MHPPASRCGICLRRCSRIFTGLLSLIRQPSGQQACGFFYQKKEEPYPAALPTYCGCLSLPERSSKIALFVSSCVSAFSLLLPSAHSACCQVKSLDISLSIYTIFPLLSNTPLLFFRSMYREPTPAFFPYPATPPCIRSLSGCFRKRIEGFCGCENSIIYVMVTAPPLFSAPPGPGSGSGSGSGLRIGIGAEDRNPEAAPAVSVSPGRRPPKFLCLPAAPCKKSVFCGQLLHSFTFAASYSDTNDSLSKFWFA